MGKVFKQSSNQRRRANDEEMPPGTFASFKKRARYARRNDMPVVKIKNPDKYLSSHQRAMAGLKRAIQLRAAG